MTSRAIFVVEMMTFKGFWNVSSVNMPIATPIVTQG